MIHIMCDLETMGNASDAAIVSIGAVCFQNDMSGESALVGKEERHMFDPNQIFRDEFYHTIDLQSCLDAGLSVTGSTIDWWLAQSEEARKAITDIPRVSLEYALKIFSVFIGNISSRRTSKDVCLWGCGSTFDNVILGNAYKKAGIAKPWSYSGDMCYRTMRHIFQFVEKPADVGTKHNALDDARYQALHLLSIMNELKSRGVPVSF